MPHALKKSSLVHSILAILAGFLADAILSVTTDAILERLGIFPAGAFTVPWMLLLALIYRTAYGVLAGYIVAKHAPNKPMKHVMILATIGTGFAILGLVGTWNMNLGPHWYPILLALFSFPSVWYGGKLFLKK